MARSHTTYRSIVALVLMGLLAIVFARLGSWQLSRATERDALKAVIDSGRTQPALELTADTPVSALVPWRSASAAGSWRHEFTVLLENRNLDGTPGYWVATPLMLTDSTESAAVLVLRGWLPRPMRPGETLAPIPAPTGAQSIKGELLSHVPRLYELPSWSGHASNSLPGKLPAADVPLPSVQNLALSDYAAATGLNLIPTVLAQTQANPTAGTIDPLRREWPDPMLDSDKNRGYALQWFGFMTIALVVCLALLWNMARRAFRHTHS